MLSCMPFNWSRMERSEIREVAQVEIFNASVLLDNAPNLDHFESLYHAMLGEAPGLTDRLTSMRCTYYAS